jgi:hypothetical protein
MPEGKIHTGGKEVIYMMTTLKITKIYIDKVKKVVIDEAEKGEELDFSQTSLEVWTEDGDEYVLILESSSVGNLKLIKKSEDWLTPKVYKGKDEEG